jgi:hypothetical protein
MYTVGSTSAPGKYMSVTSNGSVVLGGDPLVVEAQWRIQNVAGNADLYTFESAGADGKFLTSAFSNESQRGADLWLGVSSTELSAQWSLSPLEGAPATIGPQRGAWRTVHGCWDAEGLKIDYRSCPPTPAPTEKPTQSPTPDPTQAPTEEASWAVRLGCFDAQGNKLDPANCQPIRNSHAIEARHLKANPNSSVPVHTTD